MVSPSLSASRYRRRILGLGALATGALYVIGAPIFVDRIEEDLERRVPVELAAAGYRGIDATFSGQDGSLTCDQPLDDPEGAIEAAYDVRGVRAIELDRSCRVRAAGVAVDGADGESDEATDGALTDDADVEVTTPPSASSVTTTTVVGDDERVTVVDIVAANPDLAFLSVLIDGVELSPTEPFTLFAPTNAAFDAVPADQLARLQGDAELIRRVLAHHVVPGLITTVDMVDGELTATDGAALTVVVGDPITISGASLVDGDMIASNGVVHLVDTLLLPPDLELVDALRPAPAAAAWDGSSFTLTGVVASEVQRGSIVTAAVESTTLDAVVDQLLVDPDTGIAGPIADQLGVLIRAMPANLSSGESGFNGELLYASGTYRDEAARDAFIAAAASVGVVAELAPPSVATPDDAAALEAELNAYLAENPIRFEPSSAVLAGSAAAVLDVVVGEVARLTGISLTVEGHTDSDGDPAANLRLSQNRAIAVRDALITRGIAPESVEAVGFGSERPVLIDGVEDKAASRRVEFRVVAGQ